MINCECVENASHLQSQFMGLEDDDLEEVLWEMAGIEFEPYEAMRSLKSQIAQIGIGISEIDELSIINSTLISVFGYGLETIIERTERKSA